MAISAPRRGDGSPATGWALEMASAGVGALQVRAKSLADRELLDLAGRMRLQFPAPRLLFVNGRPDVAVAIGADGVQLPATGLPVAAVRRRFGAELLLGRSTHTPEEVEAARRDGADFVLFGPVWSSPGKSRPAGIEALRRAAAFGLPVYAVGGISVERLAEVAAAGAVGAAGIRLFQDPVSLVTAVAVATQCFAPQRTQ
jgi:thiamine-phosphate pyrophosphorylase